MKPPLVLVFARIPEAGRVKTRLAREVGFDIAARLYGAFTEDLVERLSARPDWTLGVAGDARWPLEAYRRWLPHAEVVWEQPSGDLGDRMAGCVRMAAAEGWEMVVLLGSDMPHLPAERIRAAIAALRTDGADLVLGPARDGGYYLAAMRGPLPIFEGVEWSTEHVLEQTLVRAGRAGLCVHLLPLESDVDTNDDWIALARRLGSDRTEAAQLPRTSRLARFA